MAKIRDWAKKRGLGRIKNPKLMKILAEMEGRKGQTYGISKL